MPKRNQYPKEKAGRRLYIFPFLSFLKNIFPHAGEKTERSHSSPHFLTRDCAVLVLHNRGKMDFSIYLLLVVSEVLSRTLSKRLKISLYDSVFLRSFAQPCCLPPIIHRAALHFSVVWLITYDGAAFIGLGRNDKVLLLRG